MFWVPSIRLHFLPSLRPTFFTTSHHSHFSSLRNGYLNFFQGYFQKPPTRVSSEPTLTSHHPYITMSTTILKAKKKARDKNLITKVNTHTKCIWWSIFNSLKKVCISGLERRRKYCEFHVSPTKINHLVGGVCCELKNKNYGNGRHQRHRRHENVSKKTFWNRRREHGRPTL